MRKIVFVLALIYSVLYCVCTVGAIILLSNSFIDVYIFLYYLLSATVSLLLLWGLSSALSRVENLENVLLDKNVVDEQDLGGEIDVPVDEKPAKGTYRCEICGYQLFDDDTECPNCGTKIK